MRGADNTTNVFGRSDMPNSLATLAVFKVNRAATYTEQVETAGRVAAFIHENFPPDVCEEVITQLAVMSHRPEPQTT